MKWLGPALLYVGLPLLLAEVTEVAPWLAGRLLRWASRLLPSEHRDRYELEWLAELDAVPGKLLKLLFAARIALRVPATRRELDHVRSIWILLGRWMLSVLIAVVLAATRLISRLPVWRPSAPIHAVRLPEDRKPVVPNEAGSILWSAPDALTLSGESQFSRAIEFFELANRYRDDPEEAARRRALGALLIESQRRNEKAAKRTASALDHYERARRLSEEILGLRPKRDVWEPPTDN